MGKGCGSGFYLNRPGLSPELNFMTRPPDPEHQNMEPMICPSYMIMNSYPYSLPANSTLPGFAMAESPSPQMDKIEPNSWYSCYNPLHPNAFLDGRFSATPYDFDLQYKIPDVSAPNHPTSQIVGKKFLVFDQPGNRRSLIFSTSYSPLQLCNSRQQRRCDVEINKSTPIGNDCLGQNLIWENGLNETETWGGNGSEMHEDTEDLEALLSSDYEEEETSTGHSPSDMAGSKRKEEEEEEEVASSGPTKRRRFEGNNIFAEETDTASSVNGHGCLDNHHEAESSCRKVSNHFSSKREAFEKRSRREKIKKTVGILRSIIPGGKGKDAALVLDDAIRYLKSLQLKAKSLGANARQGR